MNFLFQSNVVTAPILIGCSASEALRRAAQKKLNIRLVDEKEDLELPAGTIISQNPSPNAVMKTHQTLLCVISKKSGSAVPNIVGKKVDDIAKEFKDVSVKVKPYFVEAPLPQGTCFAQDPVPGASFDGKKCIVAYIARQRTSGYLFPDFKQKAVTDIVDFLMISGIRYEVQHLQEVSPDHVCVDCVVADQEPFAGAPVVLDVNKPFTVHLYASEVEPSTGNMI